ncbi:MAG TPA: alanine racemase [Planctomycetota bacterium]
MDTPALLLDQAAFERNLAAMRRVLGRARLRPHVKSHKCTAIARRQMREGAVGLSCATLDEAEAMAGIGDVLLTSPVVGAEKIARLRRLRRATVVVDHPAHVRALDGLNVGVLVDLDVGLGRGGVSTPAEAAALARMAGPRFRGLQAYSGRVQHLPTPQARERLARTIARRIRDVREAVGPCEIVSGGGTGSADVDAALGVFTEIQAGSYVFMDQIYLRNRGTPFRASLRVACTIVSVRPDGSATVDAGTKQFPRGPVPEVDGPGRYRFAGDEHGRVFGLLRPTLGARVYLRVPHCDPTVNLYPALQVVARGRVAGTWRIDARRS